MDGRTLGEHKRSKLHKQRVKELKDIPYSHKEADNAAGMGSYILPSSTKMETEIV